MNDIVKGVLIGVLSTSILSGVGFFFLVIENQFKIENIEKAIDKLLITF
jgi:hypothetical protein